jgi:hypothetical protein
MAVSIGAPQSWPLHDLFRARGERLPPEIALLAEASDFWLVRLACSFRPRRQVRVDWARFGVTLHGAGQAADPVAFDLYPKDISVERRGNVKVGLTPKLKLSDLEVELGEAVLDFQYDRLEPLITGSGVLQANPAWEFEPARGHPLTGSRFMHLVVKCPRGGEGVRASFHVEADLVEEGVFRWRWWSRQDAEAHRTTVICKL